MTELVLGAHAVATCAMAGLIWFVQVVHYPLMSSVGREGWVAYERRHTARTSLVVAPLMLVELVTAAILAAGIVREADWLAWTGIGLVGVVWASTFFVQVPLHQRLSAEWSDRAHAALVRLNWVRTFAWSARAVVAAAMM